MPITIDSRKTLVQYLTEQKNRTAPLHHAYMAGYTQVQVDNAIAAGVVEIAEAANTDNKFSSTGAVQQSPLTFNECVVRLRDVEP